ncbi:hypothetical protein LX32DRAFT_724632 [Colletotrichum zoysiae]|uniref:CorA-like Mg2+ transporter n=1 Tax=Colletotrichum zoysiae TaxID=1216348 RepID=A0AAD9HS60_9PEZI|nr:hypothetical protein LX32DRAFT_724632 [Colletotrichum zoysiae]
MSQSKEGSTSESAAVDEAPGNSGKPSSITDSATTRSLKLSNTSSADDDVSQQLEQLKALNQKHTQMTNLLQNKFEILVDISKEASILLENVRDGWKAEHPSRLLTGITAFQVRMYWATDSWATGWKETLDKLSAAVSVTPESIEGEKQLEGLMYDPDLKRTRTYFKVLQILRIFSDIIETANVDFESFSDECSTKSYESIRDGCFWRSAEEELVLNHNWAVVKAFHKERTKKLLLQTSAMSREIESLRDGLFNAQSVKEAQKSRELNKIMMVFTVVTIVFLPPSFVATFFGVDVFHSASDGQTRKIFWTVFSSLG